MGNSLPAPPTTEKPSRRPFAPWNKRSLSNLVAQQKKVSPLQKLILQQDWQRVLCRVQLYPDELQQYIKLKIDDNVQLKVLPLHLVSALDPPLPVVESFLRGYADAAALPVQPVKGKKNPQTDDASGSRGWKDRYQIWRRNRSGAFPVVVETGDGECFEDAQQSLLQPSPESSETEAQSVFVTAVQSNVKITFTDNEDDDESANSSSISSRQSLAEKNIILQLSPSGGLQPMPVHTVATDETESASTAIFCVDWDLQPLQEHVTSHGTLLALHIACFYSASTHVLKAIADAYPAAALCDVVGMLPIHWIAAGWSLPPLLPPLASPLPAQPKPSPLEAMKVLKDTVPDSVRVRSGNHNMTPNDYVQECMEESDLKDACMRLLQEDDDDSLDDSIIFSGSDASSGGPPPRSDSVCCLSSMVAERDWEGMLVAIEDHPPIASRWIYGMDENAETAVVWKRLPIHLACGSGAPVGLVSIVLQAYPAGILAADPLDGATPLHISCRSHASPTVIRLLLSKCPEATRAVNFGGQIPLHVAILSRASYNVVEALLEDDPMSISVPDSDGATGLDHAKRIYGDKSVVFELMTMIHLFLSKPDLN